MADVHVYLGLVSLGLNASQKDRLVQALRGLGPTGNTQPCHLNHRCVRADGDAVIFEALFDDGNISIAAIKGYLGNVFDVDPEDISHNTSQKVFAALPTSIVTFGYGGTDRIRMAFFGKAGDDWPTWKQSRDECAAYIAANSDDWVVDSP